MAKYNKSLPQDVWCAVFILLGGTERKSNENRRICVGRKRSLYAKAITFLIQDPANTLRRGERKRGQRRNKYTCGQALSFLNVCFQKTSSSLRGIFWVSSIPRYCINLPASSAAQLHWLHECSSFKIFIEGICWSHCYMSNQIIPAILSSLCNCSTTQDRQDVLWLEEHYLSGADAFLCFDKSPCSGILGDLSRHDDGRETDPLACARAGKQTARSRGQERSGHHAADSSDLFLISGDESSPHRSCGLLVLSGEPCHHYAVILYKENVTK